MKLTLTLALLLASSQSIRIQEGESQEMRLLMDDGFTHVVMHESEQNLLQYIDVSSPFDEKVVLTMFSKDSP